MTKSAQKQVNTPSSSVRVIKTADTPNISDTSLIGYQLGVHPDGNLMIRILTSVGGGFFSMEWIAIPEILEILQEWDADNGITSVALRSLFRGRSVNTPAFLMAALKSEGVIQPLKGKKRNFELGDVSGFLQTAMQLQTGKAAPRKAARPKAPAKAKAAAKAPRSKKKPTPK